VFRQGPNRLVFNSVQALHGSFSTLYALLKKLTLSDIYQNERLFKSQAYLVSQPLPDTYNLFNVIDKGLHRTKRRLIGQGVNEKAMREFEPVMAAHINTFVKELVKSCERPNTAVDMTERCRWLGLDVIGELGFGTNLQLQNDKKNRFMVGGLETSNFRINLYIQFPLLKKAGMELLLFPYIATSQMKYYKMLRDLIVARRKEDKHARKDLYSFVVDLKDPDTGESMRLRDIWTEAAFFMPAGNCITSNSFLSLRLTYIPGGDTTATALSAAFFYLSRYPSCYDRLATEIRTVFSSASQIRNGPQLASCVYLRACIDETLRMTPPICTTLWRAYPKSTAISEALVIDGHVIPPGTEVGVNIYTMHHNAQYFPEPYTYKPERWLQAEEHPSEHDKAQRKLMRDAFTPFSIGSRGCGGKAMAYLEASLTLAKTLWYLDFQRPESSKLDSFGQGSSGLSGGNPEYYVKDQFSSVHHGPNLMFKPRHGFSKTDMDTLTSEKVQS
jgi:cytochrome P450